MLDPFVGSGSTCAAAIKSGRHYIGYDTSEEYVRLAEKRIRQAKEKNVMPIFETAGVRIQI